MLSTKSNAICVIISNIISAVIVFVFCILQAPDIAITEAVIGTATSTILYSLALLYIKRLPTSQTQNLLYNIDIRQRIFVLLLCTFLFSILIFTIQNLPKAQIGDISNIQKLSKLYIKYAIQDFKFSSIVTAVVAGYRAFDTLFENVVIFTACYGFYVLLKIDPDKDKKDENNERNQYFISPTNISKKTENIVI